MRLSQCLRCSAYIPSIPQVLFISRHLIAFSTSLTSTTISFVYLASHLICWISISLIQLKSCLKWDRHNSVISSIPVTSSILLGKGILQLFTWRISFQKSSGLLCDSFFANESFLSWHSWFFRKRIAYLNRALDVFIRSNTGPCFGLPASIHIMKHSLAAVWRSLAWSFQPGLHLYGFVLPCRLTSSPFAFFIDSMILS